MPTELLDLLHTRLDFVQYFYATGVKPFAEIKRKIEASEEPYVDWRDPEWADDEPAFLREHENADIGAELVGVSVLAFIQAVFHAYLERMVVELGGEQLLHRVSQMGKGSSFQNYRELFLQCNIDWAGSGVDLDFLEQSILTRNDFMHNVDLLSAYVYQGGSHYRKHPLPVSLTRRGGLIFCASQAIVDRRHKQSHERQADFLRAQRRSGTQF
jgi:hypothetical protein